MKKVFLLSPAIAALLFSIPQAWQMIQSPGESYVPVVYELLLFVFSYLAAMVVNLVLVLPLSWVLFRYRSSSVLTGVVFGLVLALLADIVAYAFEIFGYQDSIFHLVYLYRVFLPLLFLGFFTFFFLRGQQLVTADDQEQEEQGHVDENAD